jgi:pimeloyl-ACP methyl ester carboxylesterase
MGNQVPALIASGYRAILIDSCGHGRSTRDARPFMYERMASDVLAVMDALTLEKAAVVGWSDGACIALILAMQAPRASRVSSSSAATWIPAARKRSSSPIRSSTAVSADMPGIMPHCRPRPIIQGICRAVGLMQATQPNYGADDLAAVRVPVTIVQSEHDEFIKREHAEYLARVFPVRTSSSCPV